MRQLRWSGLQRIRSHDEHCHTRTKNEQTDTVENEGHKRRTLTAYQHSSHLSFLYSFGLCLKFA